MKSCLMVVASGTIFFDDQGRLQEVKPNIPEIKGTINDVPGVRQYRGPVSHLIKSLYNTFYRSSETGNLRVNYDLDLVTGFGGPFSTAVEKQMDMVKHLKVYQHNIYR